MRRAASAADMWWRRTFLGDTGYGGSCTGRRRSSTRTAEQILGCAVLGSEGGEIMGMIQVAMLGKLTYTAMANAIFTHPLLAEGLNTLCSMLDATVSADTGSAA